MSLAMGEAETHETNERARKQAPWFRIACLLAVVEIVGLIVVVILPELSGPARTFEPARALVSDRAAPPDAYGRRPTTPTTTAPPVPTTTVPPAPPPTPPPAAPPTTVPPAAAAARARTSAPAPPPRTPPPAPATTGHPILPPANPPANIAPSPNFLSVCSGSGYDDSSGCVATTLAAIANARRSEGLPALVLPGNWGALTPTEQLFVATNLERTVRGLPALSSMASAADVAAQHGADVGDDPSAPPGFPFTQWAANWAGGVGNPLEAIYYWMYDDGPGSSNLDCTPGTPSGCWGHCDKILLAMACRPCVMGTGYAPQGWSGKPSWAELLVDTSGAPAVDFTWQQELAYLP
jgi:hypothetical protein